MVSRSSRRRSRHLVFSRGQFRHGHIVLSPTVRDDDQLMAVRRAKKKAGMESGVNQISLVDKGRYGNEHIFQQLQPSPFSISDDLVEDCFKNLESDAADVGNPMPAQSVVDEAKRIVLGLRPHLPHNVDVYTMEEGKIAVFGHSGRGFLLICEPGSSALCIVTIGSVSRRARYESSTTLPDGFLKEGLQEVQSVF